MTQPTQQRDTHGRFIKPEQDAQSKHAYTEDEVHPLAQFLFGWVEHPRTPLFLLGGVIGLSVILVLMDFIVHRHDYFGFAEFAAYYAFWGFAAFTLAVLSGWPLGALLRGDEDYYGEAETTPDDVESGS